MLCEDKVTAPVARGISQGLWDVGGNAGRECWVIAVQVVRTWNVSDIESQFVHHDLEAAICEAKVVLFLVTVEPPWTGPVKEKVRERFVEPHHLAIVIVENGV
jgi:hypothetical protein